MTKRQYILALERHHFVSEGFMGYYDLGLPGNKFAASVLNAGPTRRARLAYLLRKRDEEMARRETQEVA